MKRFCLSIFFLFISGAICALSIGSDTTPSRQGHSTFLQLDSVNKMNGFGAFENGFTFQDASTTCSFDAFFPVSGSIDMRAGTLRLTQDLILDSITSLTNMGTVYGNGRAIEIAEAVNTFTSYASSESVSSAWAEVTNASQPGSGAALSVSWSYDDAYIGAAFATTKKAFVYSFNGTALGGPASLNIDSLPNAVRIHPSAYYWAFVGDYIKNKQELTIVAGTTSLSQVDAISVNENVNSVGWSANGSYLAIAGDTNLYVYEFSIATETLTQRATIALGAPATDGALMWDQTNQYFAVGTTSDLRIYYYNGATTLTLTANASLGASDSVTAIDWSKTDSCIAVGTSGATNQLYIYKFDSAENSLSEICANAVGSTIYSVCWDCDGTYMFVGLALQAGTELRIYKADKVAQTLTLDVGQELTTNILSMACDHSNTYIAFGTAAELLHVYSFALGYDTCSVDSVVFDTLTLMLNNDMSWKMATTIQNECVIDAHDNRIVFEEDGIITITAGAQLTIQNAELIGLTNQNFVCFDDTASIILRNCTVRLSNDFIFEKGSILFDRDVIFTGTNKFIYSSQQTSTIATNSTLMFDHDVTFSYDPLVANRDLLHMTDQVAFLYLNGCILYSTATGVRLTRGTVFIDNAVTFSCDGTEQSEAISFGDGTADNDVRVRFLSDATLQVYGGLYENNVN